MSEPFFPRSIAGYRVDLLFTGFPGKSTYHGGLGWSTVALLRGHGRTILLDTGGFGLRVQLKERLARLGVAPADVTDLLLSHAHWDHVVNYPLFPAAAIHIGRAELAWARAAEVGTQALPELYVAGLAAHPRLNLLDEGMDVFPGIEVIAGPGHSPGHLVFVLGGSDGRVIFAQDAAKTRAELVSRTADITVDPALSTGTIGRIWTLWRQHPGTVLVPGHDLPMVLDGDRIRQLGCHEAGIKAAFGDAPTEETVFRFQPAGPAAAH